MRISVVCSDGPTYNRHQWEREVSDFELPDRLSSFIMDAPALNRSLFIGLKMIHSFQTGFATNTSNWEYAQHQLWEKL
jgi:hypothetical protein